MPIIRRMDREMAVYSYSGVVVQLLNRVQFFATPWAAAGQGSSVLHCLPEFAQIYVH